MNFLAHLYLSGNNPNLIVGNFMADAVKGNSYLKFEDEIQQGILLHREIDTFTDQHPIVKQSKRRLNKRYNHFGGIIIDIFYDHFLAKNWTQFSNIPLELYVSEVYKILQKSAKIYPSNVNRLLYFMVYENWLLSYQHTDEIKKVLTRMSYRTKHQSYMELAIEDLLLHYGDFEKDFMLFFKEMILFAQSKIKT
ncbi:MAG: ACP phosphodiesterase [Flavobacteriaceae bacterium]|nr:ACP phosphodiesterase [Flavobacteriaceae bacterium]